MPALTDQRALIPKRLHLERGPLKELHRFLEHPHCYEGLEDFLQLAQFTCPANDQQTKCQTASVCAHLVGHHDIHLLHLEELVVPATLLPKGIRAPLVQVIILVVLLPILAARPKKKEMPICVSCYGAPRSKTTWSHTVLLWPTGQQANRRSQATPTSHLLLNHNCQLPN